METINIEEQIFIDFPLSANQDENTMIPFVYYEDRYIYMQYNLIYLQNDSRINSSGQTQ